MSKIFNKIEESDGVNNTVFNFLSVKDKKLATANLIVRRFFLNILFKLEMYHNSAINTNSNQEHFLNPPSR